MLLSIRVYRSLFDGARRALGKRGIYSARHVRKSRRKVYYRVEGFISLKSTLKLHLPRVVCDQDQSNGISFPLSLRAGPT